MKTIAKIPFFLGFMAIFFLACEKTDIQPNLEQQKLNTPKSMLNNLTEQSLYWTRTALFLDGINDYIQVPDNSSLDMTGSFTIAAWIYMESYVEWASVVTKGSYIDESLGSSNNYTLHQSGNSGGGSFPHDTEFGHLRFTTGCFLLPTLPESATMIPLKQWHYVTMTFDGASIRFYLDGKPDGSQTQTEPLCPNNEPLNIGADFPGGDEYWHGAIDELRIWNIALSDFEIQLAMNGNIRLLTSNLVGYWHFNEGIGNILNDYSGHGNNGTIMGNPIWINTGY